MKYTYSFLFLPLFALFAQADEGMWLFDAAPKNAVKAKYGFEMTDEWLQHVQLSSVRFGRNGSAAFVSSNGLVMTNHHVGAGQLSQLSTPERDLLENGFYAKNFEDELPCKGLELNVLISTENVTERIKNAAASAALPDKAIRAEMTAIEQESTEKTGLKSEVVTFYQGGAYHLYRYKKYTDVRLVFAPEEAIASFGGDCDNYEFPRYCLDAAFFRAYEDGKPAKTENFFKWSKNGAKDGQLVFVSGHPGRTDRAFTIEHLVSQRDTYFPWRLMKMYRRESLYRVFGERSAENYRRIRQDLAGVLNYRKRALGQLDGLMTPSLLKTVVTESPEIAAALKDYGKIYPLYDMLEAGDAYSSRTFQIARQLVRLAYETSKPSEQRLREYRDTALDSLKATLLSDAPIYEDVEILKLTDSLMMKREYFGGQASSEQIGAAQNKAESEKESPNEMAKRLIKGSKVRDVTERKRLLEGGVKAIEASDDPMIQFALAVDVDARAIRQIYEKTIEEPLRKAYADLAVKRFEQLMKADTESPQRRAMTKGAEQPSMPTSAYPDATFTLRLSVGAVKGYTEADGTQIFPITVIQGMFDRAKLHNFVFPFNPPKSWIDAKPRLDMNTPFNFVSTNDIIGGNSGSPAFNAEGEIVGLVFDGNIYSLSNNFIHSDKQSRCVSVHSAVIEHSLRYVYGAGKLAEELGN